MVKKNYRTGSRPCNWVNGTKLVILVAALMGSAYVLAMALRSPEYWWVTWISLLPLFWAIRTLKPIAASLSGAIWGISFFLFSSQGAQPVISFTFSSLTILALNPAIYCGLGSLLTRRVGFNPLILALGWIGVEFAFTPLGLHNGLLSGTQLGSTHFHWIGHLLSYIFIAFLFTCINASLLAILNNTRLCIPQERSGLDFQNYEILFTPQKHLHFKLRIISQRKPRGPPK